MTGRPSRTALPLMFGRARRARTLVTACSAVAVVGLVAAAADALPLLAAPTSAQPAASGQDKGGNHGGGKPTTTKSTKSSKTTKTKGNGRVDVRLAYDFESGVPSSLSGGVLSQVTSPVHAGAKALLVDGEELDVAGLPDGWYDLSAAVRLPAQQPTSAMAWGKGRGTDVSATAWTTITGHVHARSGVVTLSFDTACPSTSPSPWGFVVDDVAVTTAKVQKQLPKSSKACPTPTRTATARTFTFDSAADVAAWAPDASGVSTSAVVPGRDGTGQALRVAIKGSGQGVQLRGLASGSYLLQGWVRASQPVGLYVHAPRWQYPKAVTGDAWTPFAWRIITGKDGSVDLAVTACGPNGALTFDLDDLSLTPGGPAPTVIASSSCPSSTPTTTSPSTTTTSPSTSTTLPSTAPSTTTTSPSTTTTSPSTTTTRPSTTTTSPSTTTTSPSTTTTRPSTTTTSPSTTTTSPSTTTTSPSTSTTTTSTTTTSTTSPSTTTPVPTFPTPTYPPMAGTCKARYVLLSTWDGGFEGQLIVAHSDDLDGWAMTFGFAGNQQVTQVLGATGKQYGSTLVVTDPDVPYLEAVDPLTLAFVGTGDGATSRPTSVTLNGVTCS